MKSSWQWTMVAAVLPLAMGCVNSAEGKDDCVEQSDCLTGYECIGGKCLTAAEASAATDEYTGTWQWTQDAQSLLTFEPGRRFTSRFRLTSYDTATQQTTTLGMSTQKGRYTVATGSSTQMTTTTESLIYTPTGGSDQVGSPRTEDGQPSLCYDATARSCSAVTMVMGVTLSGSSLTLTNPIFSGPLVYTKQP